MNCAACIFGFKIFFKLCIQQNCIFKAINQNSTSSMTTFLLAQNTPWFGANGFGVIIWTKTSPLYKAWNDNDLRKQFNWYNETFRLSPWQAGQPAYPNEGVISTKKYNSPGATIATFSMPCYRYAEILLICAEASAQAAGPTPDGVEKLNMVKRRAYGLNPLQPSLVDFKAEDYTTKTFTDLIIQERAFEFQLEGKRWFDLTRTGRAKDVIKNNLFIDVADKALLWPIPRIEFDLNKGLDPVKDQNPGY